MTAGTGRPWWQEAVFYQVYPRSFADGNGDGIGDLPGIIDRLDYIRDLGVDAIWLSPHYPSPQFDCGYDVADFVGVAPEYGTLDDFRLFLEGAHARGLRVIIDLVLNHTSDQHPWFVESRSSRDSSKRDWYIWRDGRDGGPPNDWYAWFDDSAWESDPATEQFYYHCFFTEQPDLNWRNPEVRAAMWDVVRFWLDLGVDGFRLDAVGTIFEAAGLPDHEAAVSAVDLRRGWLTATSDAERLAAEALQVAVYRYQVDLPEVHDVMRELRAVVDEYEDRVLVAETEHLAYHGAASDGVHLVFNFPLMRTANMRPEWIRANQRVRLAELPAGAWPCNTLGCHDESRVRSHYGDGQADDRMARLLLALVLTLRGTPFLYNGEEIGMTDHTFDDLTVFRDNMALWFYRSALTDLELPSADALRLAVRYGRDKERTPMQWADTPNAGFSPAGTMPWLPVNPNYADGVNVADQAGDPASLLSFYRELLAVRKRTPALITGEYRPLHEEAVDYFAALRTSIDPRQTCLVVLNLSDREHTLNFELDAQWLRTVFTSAERSGPVDNAAELHIAPFEVYIGSIRAG